MGRAALLSLKSNNLQTNYKKQTKGHPLLLNSTGATFSTTMCLFNIPLLYPDFHSSLQLRVSVPPSGDGENPQRKPTNLRHPNQADSHFSWDKFSPLLPVLPTLPLQSGPQLSDSPMLPSHPLPTSLLHGGFTVRVNRPAAASQHCHQVAPRTRLLGCERGQDRGEDKLTFKSYPK